MGIDADGLQILGHLAYTVLTFCHTCLPATGTHEEHLVGLLEVGCIRQLVSTDGATAEDSYVGKRGGVVERDAVGLHATHRETGHRTVLGVGNHTVVLLDHRDDVLDEHFLEGTAHATGHTGEVGTCHTGTTARTSLRTTGTLTTRATLRCSLRTGTARTGTAEAHRLLTRTAGIQTIVHEDDKRNGLAVGNQVVHDDARLTLGTPAGFVLAHTMLQVEHGELLVRIGIILGGQIDKAVTHRLGDRRPVINLVDRSLRHVFHRIKILVGSGHIDTASPTAGTIIILAARIRHRGTVDVELIIVESLVLRSGSASPDTILVLGHLINLSGNVKAYESGLGCRDLCTDHTLRVHHRVLFVLLVG